jgi:hypothetical protein
MHSEMMDMFNLLPSKKFQRLILIFITFHSNDKSIAICTEFFIGNFKLTAEKARAQVYPAGWIVMKTWDDHVQDRM